MTKNKEKAKKTLAPKNNGIVKKLVILFPIILLLSLTVFAITLQPKWQKIITAISTHLKPDQNIETTQNTPKTQLPSLAPDNTYQEPEIEHDDPSPPSASQTINPSKEIDTTLVKINNYRLFLASTQKMISKFYRDEMYDQELATLEKLKYPNHISAILLHLCKYNQLLHDRKINYGESIRPFNSSIIAHFIQITKIPDKDSEAFVLKMSILNELDILENYFYSQQMQNSFLTNTKTTSKF
ncbi:MAG: hypothetical protein AB8B66_06365 [Rickettsiaceae bacterium]